MCGKWVSLSLRMTAPAKLGYTRVRTGRCARGGSGALTSQGSGDRRTCLAISSNRVTDCDRATAQDLGMGVCGGDGGSARSGRCKS